MIASNNLNENTCVTKMDMIPSEAGGSLEPPWIWCMLAICSDLFPVSKRTKWKMYNFSSHS
jgi:hypothetical protein